MAYQQQSWQNEEAGGTPISADRLNHIEVGIGAASVKNDPETFSAAKRCAVVTLTSGAAVALDMNLSNNFLLSLDQNAILSNPINIVVGQTGTITVLGGDTFTLAYDTYYSFENGQAPSLSGSWEELYFKAKSATEIFVGRIGSIS